MSVSLTTLVTAALTSLEPAASTALVAPIVAAATASTAPFHGPARVEAAALALVAIAWHESRFAPDVSDCRRRGDVGRSITAWQLMGPWAWRGSTARELCASPELAATRALEVLSVHATRCEGAAPVAWFSGYASGSCSRGRGAARARCRTWERLARAAGLGGASCARQSVLTKGAT